MVFNGAPSYEMVSKPHSPLPKYLHISTINQSLNQVSYPLGTPAEGWKPGKISILQTLFGIFLAPPCVRIQGPRDCVPVGLQSHSFIDDCTQSHWWFGTFFSIYWQIIIPTDIYRSTTNQMVSLMIVPNIDQYLASFLSDNWGAHDPFGGGAAMLCMGQSIQFLDQKKGTITVTRSINVVGHSQPRYTIFLMINQFCTVLPKNEPCTDFETLSLFPCCPCDFVCWTHPVGYVLSLFLGLDE